MLCKKRRIGFALAEVRFLIPCVINLSWHVFNMQFNGFVSKGC